MNYPPTVADFKANFARDFKYGTGFDVVQDADITRALNEAPMVFNADLFDTSASGDGPIAFCFLAAHLMVLNIQAAGGLSPAGPGKGANSHGGGAILSKSVGSVSVSLSLPAWVTESAVLSQFLRTDYGQKYLQFLSPRLVGGAFVVAGTDETGQSNQ